MSVPIIICDDSSFARKQVARALPKGWEVDITYATNGQEGVEAITAGKGDVLFLDLTMPVMDGFEVLEYIRANDLPTLPIVISGDIQQDSFERVMQLGAVTFIKKPVDANELCKVLDKYGVLDILTGADVTPSLAPASKDVEFDVYDWCQEISNVAMGRAADLLSKMIDDTVLLSIPKVNMLESSDLDMMLSATSSSGVFAVNQGFIGRRIAGETIVMFDQQDMEKITTMMGNFDDVYESPMEITNILVGAFLRGFADQLDIKLSQGHPEIYVHDNEHRNNDSQPEKHDSILAIELCYTLGPNEVRCDQLILFTQSSYLELIQLLDFAMDPL